MAGTTSTEELLANEAGRGDRSAFEELVQHHLDALSRFAALTCRSAVEAQGAVKAALDAAWRDARSMPCGVPPRIWFFRFIAEACRGSASPGVELSEEPSNDTTEPVDSVTGATASVPSLLCEQVVARLSEYIDGDLAFDDQAEMEKHLRACNECLRFSREMRATVESLHAYHAETTPLSPEGHGARPPDGTLSSAGAPREDAKT